ncbi:MAG: neutral/alkaline non-lysosomal ceramidase N-terminal domain-containing protein [Thermoguttaceae bacterium]|nr:neutral/alkaline non-lysosomal ceramidase N-terminal domain-containing protein [Thermoguttaceae bacterium]MBQ6619411.1 neutral/alkaline non-lysosomal ceramidase N-terminal domain-containing protein [Thermoguttaceae bacterium]
MKRITFFAAALAVTLAAAWSVAAIAAETLTVGAAHEDITPDRPVLMGGYAVRTAPHEGVRTPIFTRALFVKNDSQQILWTVSDLIGLEPEDALHLAKKISEATGVPADRVVISTTHTHSGPATLVLKTDPWYLDGYFTERLIKAAVRAVESAEPCTMVVVQGEAALAYDRRNDPPPGDTPLGNADVSKAEIDKRVPAVGFRRADGSFKAVLIQYAMHPTSWGDQLIGSEWPGATATAITETFGERTEPFVLQGAAGNLGSPCRRAAPEEMLRWGRVLTEAVADQLKTGQPEDHFNAASAVIDSEYVRLDPEAIHAKADEYRKMFSGDPKLVEFFTQWEAERLAALENDTEYYAEGFYQAVAFGKHVFVTTPFETFCHLNRFLCDRVSFPVHVIGYTNGTFNYFPDIESFKQGGYEPEAYIWYDHFPLKPGGLEKLADDLVPLLEKAEE